MSYPTDGISHFRMLYDNLRLAGMHVRLVLGMLWRAPMAHLARLRRSPRRSRRIRRDAKTFLHQRTSHLRGRLLTTSTWRRWSGMAITCVISRTPAGR